MTPVRYFRLSLLLPIGVPILLLLFGNNFLRAFFTLYLFFGGLYYILFAVAMYFVIGRLRKTSRIQTLAIWSPVLFVPVQALGRIISGLIQKLFDPNLNLSGTWATIPAFAVYILIIGYAYVALVLLVFYGLQANGRIAETTPDEFCP